MSDTKKPPMARPTISIGLRQYEDGSWGVELTVTGLASEAHANAACDHMQRQFCGAEIKVQ